MKIIQAYTKLSRKVFLESTTHMFRSYWSDGPRGPRYYFYWWLTLADLGIRFWRRELWGHTSLHPDISKNPGVEPLTF